MNPRVLELLKNPKNIQPEDLNLLKEEIDSFPYIQNVRALHLYGAHLYHKENYQKELSTTAAYTTDKKILYQLINGKIEQKPKQEVVNEKQQITEKGVVPVLESESPGLESASEKEDVKASEKNFDEAESCSLITPKPEIKTIYVNGERNRILFEGEENFLEEDNTETIDIESTLESGTLVTQRAESTEAQDQAGKESIRLKGADKVEELEPEVVINEDDKPEEESKEAENAIEPSLNVIPEVKTKTNDQNRESEKSELGLDKVEEVINEPTPEVIVEEEKIISSQQEKEEIQDDSELSFHGMDSFMPEVKIQSGDSGKVTEKEISQPNIHKHEDEMRRLIEEVEKKMKEKRATSPEEKKVESSDSNNHDINFAETQSFHIESTGQKIEKEKSENTENVEVQPIEEVIKPAVEMTQEVKVVWKPMSLESNLPDSLINKTEAASPTESKAPVKESPKQEEIVLHIKETTELGNDELKKTEIDEKVKEKQDHTEAVLPVENKEEVPVMNVSFFGSDISSLKLNESKKEEEAVREEIKETLVENSDSQASNIPGFINTWQSWLKIDRTEETGKVKVENKLKVIDSFIENNPKITQLKEESSYVVKERTDDISHLMTETLANLYFEQKLYTKAMKAFTVLAEKHPDKKEYFEGKIQEIKDLRGKS